MFKRLFLGLKTTKGRLKAIIFISGIVLLTLVLTIGAIGITRSPVFCGSCHEMRPEYVTWKASSHSNLSCVECHMNTTVDSLLYYKGVSFKKLYKHFTGKITPPFETDQTIKDEVCERCHTSNRVVTPSGDIKIPHSKHKENNIPCVTCHQAVAHAKISEDGFTADGNWDKWIEPMGRAYMRQDFLKFSMEECVRCHQEEGVGPELKNCSACHTKLVKPEGHKEPIFLTQHGLKAREDLKQCDKCHQKTMSITEPKVPVDDPLVVYARQNTFCAECHSSMKKAPPSHTIAWKRTHIVPATNDRTACLVCHDEGKPTRGSKATKTYCYQCHKTNIHYNVIVLGKHLQGPPVNSSFEPTKDPCFRCHTGRKCESCHYIPDSTAELNKPEFRKPLPPGAKIIPGWPGYDGGPPSGESPDYNNPPIETG